jgi:hypothetical protein
MTLIFVLFGTCAFLGVLNLVATIMLSNAVYRAFAVSKDIAPPLPSRDSGLVEIKDSPTYDPRFRT